ncbi:type VI secretion system tip protein VgrG [Pelomonas cellulosilytica]|uniref:Type VI secretion system tip protein VgrG n=1 Tax=Pelomonas cellulosilytica TaxID=2906762 RepID=A0ABS8XYB0_9BURK|nr:type VI secretion system tip protein VgrG [Pelomonas sp. P8]MCE4554325.1 type VI secretion system tip protein VgrG [Pelomonas sp. P8]
MADSPLLDSIGVVTLSVMVDGQRLAHSDDLVSVTVQRAANTVPSARLVFNDGDMPERKFPISDTDDLKPGALLTVKAGYGQQQETLFEGIVVRHGLRVLGANDARLVVDCRDKAVKMTVGRRNANHLDVTDSDVIDTLIAAHGLTADVEATTVTHRELAQHFCCDWDFMLARAEANGLLVIATDGTVAVKPPKASGAAALTITYGVDLISFEGDVDARHQYASAQAFSWDPKAQQALEGTAADPATLPAQGNLDTEALSAVIGLDSFRMQAGAPQTQDMLTQWAKAQQVKSGLARVRGQLSFQGCAKVKVGELIELKGVGNRFNGNVLVTGLRHRIEDGDWTTEVEFGLDPDWFCGRTDVPAPAAGALLPPITGLQVGVVTKLDADPAGEHRVQVKLPVLQAETEGVWARLMQGHASSGFGSFLLPEVDDEVVLGYFAGDPSHPVVLGSLYSSSRQPPYDLAAPNDTKAFVTRCKHKLEFDEKDKVITLTTPGGNRIVLSDKDKSILLEDQNGNTVKLSDAGIALDSPKDITLTAKGGIKLDAVNAITLTSKADVKASGLNVACEAQIGFTGKGNATAEVSASGQTTVKGALVMIN